MTNHYRQILTGCSALALLLVGGCMLRDVQEQVRLMESACVIEGRVAGDLEQGRTVVVALTPGDSAAGRVPEPIEFTLADASGAFTFALPPGDYQLLAFQDLDRDLELDDNEAVRHGDRDTPLECGTGERIDGEVMALALAAGDRLSDGAGLSIQREDGAVAGAMDSAVSLGQLTAFGEVAPLSDSRFDPERARDSLWRPVDFLRAGHAGVYFTEPLDPDRTPVLFVHGINGSPRVLEPLIEGLDGERFQPMYFYYPSGLRIGQIAWYLDRIMRDIEHRQGIDRYHVVAHSMGGVVARAWLLDRPAEDRAEVASLVTLSTPWNGYPSARQGVDHSPVVVPVWRDMATSSEFLDGLYGAEPSSRELPPHHLLFSYRQSGWMAGGSGDGVAALASMLEPEAQRQAASVFGFDAGHVDILSSEAVHERVEGLLLEHERP